MMINTGKIIYVDFCNTITNFTTLTPFYNYLFAKKKRQLVKNFIHRVASNLFNLSLGEQQLKMIAGMRQSEIDTLSRNFFDECIKPHLNHDVIQIVKKYHANGYAVVIVSGGLTEYIRYISDFMPVTEVIAKKFRYRNGRITPEYMDAPCYYHDKVLRMERFEQALNREIIDRVAISDCEDDIPMLLYANTRFVVRPINEEFRKFVERKKWTIIE